MSERIRVVHPEGGRLMTKQSMAAETDVNAVVARHVAHGVPLPLDGNRARYGDFSRGADFHRDLTAVRAAEAEFLQVPSHIRDHFRNDVGRFLDCLYDPARRGELEVLGILERQVPENAVPVEPVVAPEPALPASPGGGGTITS